MRQTVSIRVMLAGFLLIGNSSLSPAQISSSSDTRRLVPTNVLLAGLQKADDSTRAAAFYQLIGAPFQPFGAGMEAVSAAMLRERSADRQEIIQAIVQLARREQQKMFTPATTELEEWYLDYVGDVVGIVRTFRTPLAAEVLVGFITTGRNASDGLVELGQVALPHLVRVVDSTDATVRSSAAMALGRLASKRVEHGLTDAQMAQIRTKLLACLRDVNPNVRTGAVRGLLPFNEPAVRAEVHKLANDSFAIGLGDVRRFPVRDAVEEWLRANR